MRPQAKREAQNRFTERLRAWLPEASWQGDSLCTDPLSLPHHLPTDKLGGLDLSERFIAALASYTPVHTSDNATSHFPAAALTPGAQLGK